MLGFIIDTYKATEYIATSTYDEDCNMTRIYEHNFNDIQQILGALPLDEVTHVLVKPLPKNANDKNQVYWSSDFSMLGSLFDLVFGDRDFSTSTTKRRSDSKKRIPEAVFKSFHWIDTSGEAVEARNVKMLIYAQYPEMRLSGFKTVENEIPISLSVEQTKQSPNQKRLMVLARTKDAGVLAMMIYPGPNLIAQVKSLPGFMGSRVVKRLLETTGASDELKNRLKSVLGKWTPGVRLDSKGKTLPFNGTQVCGYTLEHGLDIRPNSDKDGDYLGIELKTHTSAKVTLMTTEPDMGEYKDDFNNFMKRRGYLDAKGESYRLTGVHREGIKCVKSGLTLRVMNYDPEQPFSSQLDKDIHIGLFDDNGVCTAGWSKERILNSWGAKHNEAVYIRAEKRDATESSVDGAKYDIRFKNELIWCRGTGPEKLLKAIISGIVIFDPAPKYVHENPSKSKRRSQWRVNDIARALEHLYDSVEWCEISSSNAAL